MSCRQVSLSVIIPTYQREQVLLDTVGMLLDQVEHTPEFLELLVVDQTKQHEPNTVKQLNHWEQKGAVRWLRPDWVHLTRAMNCGLLAARGTVVLYTDDDIIPAVNLLAEHLRVYREKAAVDAVVGQILQPGEQPVDVDYAPQGGFLRRYMDFPCNSVQGRWIENAMAGNFSMIRHTALALGGFDENFTPPVASRFESEFAKRLVRAGNRIWFEPRASIRHLQARSGGTRSKGSHLHSMSPRYGVGDYYFALKQGQVIERIGYICKKPFREIRTKYHLTHPWWIPGKLIGEIRAFVQAVQLYRKGPKLLTGSDAGVEVQCKNR